MNYLSTTLNAVDANARYYADSCVTTLSDGVSKGKQSITNGITKGTEAVAAGCKAASNKTSNFVASNYQTIFFAASTCATAYFAPHLFLPGTIAAVIVRLELRKLIDTYIKDEHNPYIKDSKFGPKYVNTTEFVLALAAAVDAAALATVFYTSSWTVALMPILGGVVAGNVATKIGMDLFYPASQPAQALVA
ncbi:hypothetical protein PNK_0915 [Candidatus Protochlamydia naegleriophila]|uniref:Uncharacterized protein n=1 Tax=Candidatus Protochlamydia naegleriophila TaxID=389348 RepID=A0A0U5CP90_9BACT|nr:hypothetical protein [Candidatus Protochlamydia naegleriophila]CUI16540.1 hypothetical protein PNK_0915 [Candidatus Protochlamydia naegleriophila]